jgi:hypothetical protein
LASILLDLPYFDPDDGLDFCQVSLPGAQSESRPNALRYLIQIVKRSSMSGFGGLNGVNAAHGLIKE